MDCDLIPPNVKHFFFYRSTGQVYCRGEGLGVRRSNVGLVSPLVQPCKHFKMERDHDEMVRRFAEFKNCVLHVHQVNRAGLSYKLAINKSADTSIEEKRKGFSQPTWRRGGLWAIKSCGLSADD